MSTAPTGLAHRCEQKPTNDIYNEKQVPVLTNFKDAFSFEHI